MSVVLPFHRCRNSCLLALLPSLLEEHGQIWRRLALNGKENCGLGHPASLFFSCSSALACFRRVSHGSVVSPWGVCVRPLLPRWPDKGPGPHDDHAVLPGREQLVPSASFTSLKSVSPELKMKNEEIRGFEKFFPQMTITGLIMEDFHLGVVYLRVFFFNYTI